MYLREAVVNGGDIFSDDLQVAMNETEELLACETAEKGKLEGVADELCSALEREKNSQELLEEQGEKIKVQNKNIYTENMCFAAKRHQLWRGCIFKK